MKNIIVGLSTLIIVGLMVYVASIGKAFQGGEAGKIIEDIKTFKKAEVSQKENTELNSLKDRAGNVSEFKVSQNFKSKCASCHGVDGKGILGPNLFGKTSQEIYTSLIEYKSGRKENPIMRGLLMKIEESELKELADEIGSFKDKVK
ncbi:MAG: c-type cytochrome [Arcobacter sp.]|uniref:c-type cytochrome n=1 Tax=Arcobacter sp. TaxID=1872629 RepID=UPI003B00F3E2